jgi:hypothetical protein
MILIRMIQAEANIVTIVRHPRQRVAVSFQPSAFSHQLSAISFQLSATTL